MNITLNVHSNNVNKSKLYASFVANSDNMIRNEDYEASAPPPSYDTATSIGKMGEMKRGLLRQATKTEDEQVFNKES